MHDVKLPTIYVHRRSNRFSGYNGCLFYIITISTLSSSDYLIPAVSAVTKAPASVENSPSKGRNRPTVALMKCPPVSPPPEVLVEPVDCLTSRQSIGNECLMRCAFGLSLESGDQRQVCTSGRRWSGSMIRCINDSGLGVISVIPLSDTIYRYAGGLCVSRRLSHCSVQAWVCFTLTRFIRSRDRERESWF